MKKPSGNRPGDAAKRREAAIKERDAKWDRMLAGLSEPGAAKKIDAVMNARGKAKVRPKAGESY